jgi:hypothetical protein
LGRELCNSSMYSCMRTRRSSNAKVEAVLFWAEAERVEYSNVTV